VEKNGVLFAHVPEPVFSYGGRAGWRMMGWVAVIACYWTSATLLAHVPEPIVLHGGRAGWRLMGWVAVIACYRTSATLLAHVPEPTVLHCGRTGGKERYSLRTGAGATAGHAVQ
jgi:hypothetical protein